MTSPISNLSELSAPSETFKGCSSIKNRFAYTRGLKMLEPKSILFKIKVAAHLKSNCSSVCRRVIVT